MSRKEKQSLYRIKEDEELEEKNKDVKSEDTRSGGNERSSSTRSEDSPISPSLIRAVRHGSSSTSLFFQETNLNDLDIKETDSSQRNVFHYAVSKPDVLRKILKQFKTKASVQEALHQMDNNGETPIHRAAVFANTESLEILHEYDNSLIKLKTKISKMSVLHLAVKSKSVVAVRFFLSKDSDLINTVDSMLQSPMHYAANLKQSSILELLICKGGNTTERDANGQLPIHIATNKGIQKNLELLLREDPDLIDALDNSDQSPILLAVKHGFPDVVSYLLDENADYKMKDTCGLTAFDWAVRRSLPDIVQVFLNMDSWKEVVSTASNDPERTLTMMIDSMPDMANMLLDKCVTTKGTKDHPDDYQVLYDFFCLESIDKNGSCPRFEALGLMAEKPCEVCLRHPVAVKYVDIKWRKRGFKYTIGLILLTLIFHICLMIYTTRVIGVVNKRTEIRREGGRNVTMSINRRQGRRPDAGEMMALRVVMLIIIAAGTLNEVLQIMVNRFQYLTSQRHGYRLALCIIVVLYLLPVEKALTPQQIGYGAVSVLLSWINLIQFLKLVPVLGIYIILVQKVFWTVIKIFLVVLIYLLSFASTFYVLLAEHKSFKNISISFVSTFVAMMDGIDYNDLFVTVGWYPKIYELKMAILVLFMLTMSVVVNNVLIGLAVGDTNEVMKLATFDKFLRRAKFIIQLERGLNKIPYLKCKEDEFLLEFPLQKMNIFQKILNVLYFGSKIDAVDNGNEDDEHEFMHERESNLEDRIEKEIELKLGNLGSSLRLEMKEIQDQIKEDMEEKVEKVLEKLEQEKKPT